MNILITGGAGYIGSTLVPLLLANGHTVTVVDSFMHGQANALAASCYNSNLTIVRGDARDRYIIREHLPGADVVIPLAAIVGAPACDRSYHDAVDTNRDAIIDLCGHASHEQLVVYPNTNSGYGAGGEVDETSPLSPVSLYGRTKCAAEEVVMQRQNSVGLRLATVFGASPRMRTDLMANEFVWRALVDRCIVVFEGHHRRNFIHVRDVATAFLMAIHNQGMRGQVYNVGDSRANMTKLDLATMVTGIVGGAVLKKDGAVDPDQRDYMVSNAKIEALGWRSQHSLDGGIRELARLYQGYDRFQWGNV